MTTTGATAVTPAILLSPQPPQISMSPLELDGYLTGIIVTPQAVSIRPSAWIAQLWGDDAPIFEDEAQIGAVLGAVMIHYNTLLRDIDRSLKRMEADRIVDYRPLFLSGDQKPRPSTSTRCPFQPTSTISATTILRASTRERKSKRRCERWRRTPKSISSASPSPPNRSPSGT